ncbi:MAG: choice-of-anchor D domain-containing protein [Pseudomonadota bacterium]
MSRASAPLALLVLAMGCVPEQSFTPNVDGSDGYGPQIQVDPEVIEFGAAGREETVVETFTVTNVGTGELDVEGIELGGTSTSFTILTPEEDLHFLLPGSASKDIEVAFTPLGAHEQHAQAIVSSNDADSARVTVDLYGEGLVPDLQIDPDPYDFGESYIGCAREGLFTLTNVGYDDLTIDTITLSGGGGALNILGSPALPLLLAPEEETTVDVSFLPDEETSYSATFQVTSDAPGGTDRTTASGTGIYVGDFQDIWEIPFDPPVDLLFAVDQSGSMDDDQRSLASNFSTFITRLSAFTEDWHVMVVNDDDGCNLTNGYLTTTTPNYQTTFSNAVSRGGGRWTEALLTVTSTAVENTDSGECNQGFMRSDALLHIIVVSDEPEQSASSWSTYVAQIQAKKGSTANVKISAIAGDYPGGCGTADAGVGYYEAVQATGGEFLSICSNWSAMVEDLADASIQLSEYELSHTADPDTLVVRVNGTTITSGWHYDETANSVVFQTGIPVGGDRVMINYSALANCD